jgi:hypothetical protein
MKTSLRLASLLFAAAAAVPAQSNYYPQLPPSLGIRVFTGSAVPPNTPAFEWVSSDQTNAALEYSMTPGATHLLMVHVLPDPAFLANTESLAAFQSLYPFLGLPTGTWTAGDPVLQQAGYDIYNDQSLPVVIPPVRLVAHVNAFLAGASVPHTFGPSLAAGQLPPEGALFTLPTTVSTTSNLDERYYLSGNWNSARNVFDMPQLSRRCLDVAAFRYSSLTRAASVNSLDVLIRQTCRWKVQMQVVHVIPPNTAANPTNRARITISKASGNVRTSLGVQNNDPWLAAVGVERILPSIVSADWISVGAQGHLTEALATGALGNPADAVAHFQLADGSWASCPRIVWSGTTNLAALRPTRLVFTVPATAVSGMFYVTNSVGGPLTNDAGEVVPLEYAQPNTMGLGMLFLTYPMLPI